MINTSGTNAAQPNSPAEDLEEQETWQCQYDTFINKKDWSNPYSGICEMC
jgi:hypothetical protein